MFPVFAHTFPAVASPCRRWRSVPSGSAATGSVPLNASKCFRRVASAVRKSTYAAAEPDGTLRHRLQGDATAGKVWAKTGYVDGVVTLCGYVQAQSGQTYAFSILLNGGCEDSLGHAFQDRFVNELAKFG